MAEAARVAASALAFLESKASAAAAAAESTTATAESSAAAAAAAAVVGEPAAIAARAIALAVALQAAWPTRKNKICNQEITLQASRVETETRRLSSAMGQLHATC
jgi:hypothetical protein